jgi:predicted permease
MEILTFSFNAVAPMLISILLGAFIAWRGVIKEKEVAFLNTFCFQYLLPVHIFNSVLSVDFSREFRLKPVLVFIICVTAILIIAWIVFSVSIKDIDKRSIFIACAYRSNNLIYALPLSANLFGEDGVKAAAALVPITIIFFNFYTVIVMVYHAEKKTMLKNSGAKDTASIPNASMTSALKRCCFEILKNPLIIGSVLGIALSLSRISLPAFFKNGVHTIGSSATPVAFILLGAQINFKALRGNFKTVLGACLLRLVLVPLILVPLFVFLGFRGPELGALATAFSAPVAVANMIMARNYGLAPVFAAQTVYLSTVISLFTIFCLISVLRALGLF